MHKARLFSIVALLIGISWIAVATPIVEAASIAPGVGASANKYITGTEADYRIQFKIGSAPIPLNGDLIMRFDPSFAFSGSFFVEHAGLIGSYSKSGSTVTFKTTNLIDAGTAISFSILGVINPAPGNYTVEVRSSLDPGALAGEFSNPVTIGAAPSGGGDDDIFPDIDFSCDGIVSCLRAVKNAVLELATYIPKLIVNLVVAILRSIIGLFVTALIWIGASLIQVSMNLNFKLVNDIFNDPATEAAKVGFDVTLALTNIGFVIAIIVIAFATILRRQSFAMESALPRLIVIAVLINFSLFFAITIIDWSNIIGSRLNSVVVGGSPGSIPDYAGIFGKFFIDSFSVINIDIVSIPNIPGWLDTLLTGPLNFIAGLISGLVGIVAQLLFGLLAFFALVATAIMLLIRYLALSFLIILMPIALLLNIFPNLQIPGGGGAWNKWVENFTKWVIFFPATMLFIGVGFKIAQILNSSGAAFSPFESLVNNLVVAGILIGGLMVAQKLGLAGAGYANEMGALATRRIGGRLAALGMRGGMLGGRGMGRMMRGLRRSGGGGTGRDGGGPDGGEPPRARLDLAPEIPVSTGDWFNRMDQRTGTMADMYPEGEPGGGGPETPLTPGGGAPPEEIQRLETMLGPEAISPVPTPAPETPPEPAPFGGTPGGAGPEIPTRPSIIRRMRTGIGRGMEAAGRASESRAGNWLERYSKAGKSFKEINTEYMKKNAGIFSPLKPIDKDEVKKVEEKIDSTRDRISNFTEKKAIAESKISELQHRIRTNATAPPDKKMNEAELEKARDEIEQHQGRIAVMDKKIGKSAEGIVKSAKDMVKVGGKIKSGDAEDIKNELRDAGISESKINEMKL